MFVVFAWTATDRSSTVWVDRDIHVRPIGDLLVLDTFCGERWCVLDVLGWWLGRTRPRFDCLRE